MPDLSDSVNWSEIDALNNNAAPNGWPEGMMPSGVNDAARADRGALKRFWNKVNPVQTVTPVGGVYTFTTANSAYPTGYLEGEIYCFRPGGPAIGGDQFQVNSLGIKPIWKLVSAGVRAPILAQDILGVEVQLLYVASLNAGAGAFMLVNPFVPIHGDGAGGVSVPGNLAVAGDLTMAGSIVANGGMSINGDLEVTGPLSATGYKSRSGVSGPYQTNLWNIQWAGADGAHLWIDTTDQGPIVCASGGNIVIGGSISAGSVTSSGNISAGALSVSGNTTLAGSLSAPSATIAGTITANILSGNTLQVNANANVSGTFTCSTNAQISNNITASYVTANGTGYKPFGGPWDVLSDRRIKRDIEPYERGLDAICALRPVTYSYNGLAGVADDGRKGQGLIADEVIDVMPEMVTQVSVKLHDGDAEDTVIHGMSTTALSYAIVNAIKELADRVKQLERK